jgi:hypothetical protein
MNFSERIWTSALKSWGALFTIIGVIASIISFFVVPSATTLPLNWTLVIVILLVSLVSIFARAAFDAHTDSKMTLPKVRTVIDPPSSYSEASALLLLDPTELLSHDSIVSVYYNDSGIERLSGIGKVVNIQNNKMVQVILIKDAEFSKKVDALKANKPEDLEKLIVKPSVPSFYLGGD